MPFDHPSLQSFSFTYFFIAIGCVFLNAFFVAAEFSMVKIRSTRLVTLQDKGTYLAAWALEIVENLNSYLSATQLGVTLSSLALGWVGEPVFSKMIEMFLVGFDLSASAVHGISIAFGFAIISILHLVLGELVPKQLAIQKAEKILLFVAVPMRIFYWVFFPTLWILNGFTNKIIKIFRIRSSLEDSVHSEAEIRLIVEDSYEEGSISPRKASMIENIFEFGDIKARHIMVPRREIVYLLVAKSSLENLEIAKESGHTRFPICDGDLDHVLGLVNIKDVIWEIEDPDNLINLYDLKRPILFVPEGTPIDQLLREFQSKKIHMAVIVDEFGSTSGLVTIEDVLEEIVGEIQDEFDQEQPKIFKQADDSFLIDGKATLREVEQSLDLALHDDDNVTTIAGFFISRLGRLAKEGDEIDIPPFQVKALEIKNRRVSKLLFTKSTPDSLN